MNEQEREEAQKQNFDIMEPWVMKEIIKPTVEILVVEIPKKLRLDPLGDYIRGDNTQDKGINKFTEQVTDEVVKDTAKKIHEGAGGTGTISCPMETMSDTCIKIYIPQDIRGQLTPVDGAKPEMVIINVDAKGCILEDGDSKHELFHTSRTQTSIREINSHGSRRKNKKIMGQQSYCHHDVLVITADIKHVWDCEIGTSNYKTKMVSGYIIPNGLSLRSIKNVARAPKSDTEIRFDIHKDLHLKESYHCKCEITE